MSELSKYFFCIAVLCMLARIGYVLERIHNCVKKQVSSEPTHD